MPGAYALKEGGQADDWSDTCEIHLINYELLYQKKWGVVVITKRMNI